MQQPREARSVFPSLHGITGLVKQETARLRWRRRTPLREAVDRCHLGAPPGAALSFGVI